jgi:hypothetical protein
VLDNFRYTHQVGAPEAADHALEEEERHQTAVRPAAQVERDPRPDSSVDRTEA